MAQDLEDLIGTFPEGEPHLWTRWFDDASTCGMRHYWWVTPASDVATAASAMNPSTTDLMESQDLSGSHALIMEPLARLDRLSITVDVSWLGPVESGAQVMTVAAVEAIARRNDVSRLVLVGVDDLPAYAQKLLKSAKVQLFPRDTQAPRSDVMWFPHQIYSNTDVYSEGRLFANRVVVTYLDFISYDIPTYHKSQSAQLTYRALQRRIALAADGISTISSDVANRLLDDVPEVDPRRVKATSLGLDHMSDQAELENLPRGGLLSLKIFVKRYGTASVDRPFILVFGNSYLHKNREFALKVWERLVESGVECDLVMAGATVEGSAGDKLTEVIEDWKRKETSSGEFFLVDWNTDEASRIWLLANSAVVLYPTSSEGFGLPPYEAAALGTPATFTSFGPLREVAEIPDLPSTWSVNEFLDDLLTLLTDPVAAQKRVNSLEQAIRRHTWDEFAHELVTFMGNVSQMPVSQAGSLGGTSDVASDAVAKLFAPAVTECVEANTVISIVVPICNVELKHLHQCITSVIDQTSCSWELVVIFGAASHEGGLEAFESLTAEFEHDARVKVINQSQTGATDALNTGLATATGTYVGILDPEDLLDPACIEEFGSVLTHRPEAVYCDEDKIYSSLVFIDPFHKPDFSPELLLSQNILCHFAIFRRDLVMEVGGFRDQAGMAQDYDLALRLLPRLKTVVHIPRALYHWRAKWDASSFDGEVDQLAQDADALVQLDHLERTFGGGSVTPSSTRGINRVHPRIDETTKVSVILPTIGKEDGRGWRLVDTAVRSLMESESRLNLEFIVITAGAMEEVRMENLHGHTLRHIDYPAEIFNFAEKINLGCSVATGEYLLLLNDDTEVISPNPVSRMLEIGQIPEVAVTGCLLTFPDGRMQHAGIIMSGDGPYHCWSHCDSEEKGYFGSTLVPRNFSAVTASVVLIRASVFRDLGGFDTQFPMTFNDVDFCLRAIEHGYRVAWTPYAHWTHFENASLQRVGNPVGQDLFDSRWQEKYRVDPFYSPALNPRANQLFRVKP
jgi:GT2 family glycosyltransferase/glycosyltransferase involved in cell wall biosynthesis